MINKPKIILLDEPYANLDPQVVQDIQKYIFKIQSMKVSIIITDHNIKNLFDTTDTNYVISDGSIIAEKAAAVELTTSSMSMEIKPITELLKYPKDSHLWKAIVMTFAERAEKKIKKKMF